MDKSIVNSSDKLLLDKIEGLLSLLAKKPVASMIIIGLIGTFLRLYYFPHDIPLIKDAFGYFLYATDLSILGHLPTNLPLANNGWPIFLSIFFSAFRFDNPIEYVTLQRIVTLSLSITTIIPVYFLCRRFFDKPYAILGAAIFSFEPHIIQNSILGITEPLFILMITSSITLFFSARMRNVYSSFAILSFASLVRAEGLFVFFAFVIIFFLKFREARKMVGKIFLAVAIFILLLLPMLMYRVENTGYDALTGRVILGSNQLLTSASHGGLPYVIKTLENVVKLGGWSLIPFFIILVPTGVILVLRKRNFEQLMIIVMVIFMMLPVFYAFSFEPDTKYIYPLFPLFCVLSSISIKRLETKTQYPNIFLVLVIGGILLSSAIFLDLKKFNYEHQIEAFNIAQYITNSAKGINSYSGDGYILPAELPQKWPSLSTSIPQKTTIISTQGFDSLKKYIESSRDKGLTHLVIDDSNDEPQFLNDVFYDNGKYPYLKKVFDSLDLKYNYHVKIYKIDYESFYSIIQ